MPVVILFLFMSLLIARDDPFTPLVEPKDSIRPYYGETSVFDKAQIELPSNARLIKRVEITYQNIDGSIESKSMPLKGRVDWRMPITISQELGKVRETKKPDSSTKSAKLADSKNSKNSKNSKDSKTKAKDSANLAKSTNYKDSADSIDSATFAKLDFTKDYDINDNSIFIRYGGALIRDFAMQNPYRIVLDFKKNEALKRQKITLNRKYFTMIRYGLHDNFIRIVVELDGRYIYEIAKRKNGIVINVK